MFELPILITLGLLGAAPTPGASADHAAFEQPGFRCVIGNNAALGAHQERYNGLFSITTDTLKESPFVEKYAGLNLEHYFDGRPRPADDTVLFEPRVAPMSFARIDEKTAELHQPTTPFYKVESWTRFTLNTPNAVDMQFRCIPREDVFKGGFFGVFWASYINAPEDKSLYFLRAGSTLDAPIWEQFSTQRHGTHSSLLHEKDTFNPVFEQPNDLLYASQALFRYSEPFFYGRYKDHVLLFLFKPGPLLRFTQSPSGGGPSKDKTSNNPAWDFQLIVPDYQVDKEYGLEMRLVLMPWNGRASIIEEVRKYLGSPRP